MVPLSKSVRYDETVTLVLQKKRHEIHVYICSSPIIIRMAGGFKKMDAFLRDSYNLLHVLVRWVSRALK
jgi:hypothetical protein